MHLTCFRRSSGTLVAVVANLLLTTLFAGAVVAGEPWQLRLRHQDPVAEGVPRYHRSEQAEAWDPETTAVIVCDMWDSHHCFRAVGRVQELAPRMDAFLITARQRGATIIHAPSSCMEAYQDHPSRDRALAAPSAGDFPDQIDQWCYQIPAEEAVEYPIDQSDGGEDDTAEEHAAWVAELERQGRNPRAPWLKQIDRLSIDADRDYISDSGKEIWNILRDRGIERVMLVGVHTNMCVLGRPFGLRRMVAAGMPVVLVRDLTDTMYNPQAWPYVSHFSGTDLIIDHIERHVCPTISSDQVLGGAPLRFADDDRPHVALLISEPEYDTARTLTDYARENLQRDFRLSYIYGSEDDGNRFPGLESLAEADVLLLSVRRRTPPAEQLKIVRDFIDAGKPVVGIRTANHAFHLRNQPVPDGAAAWSTFDPDVFGGSYSNHYGNDLETVVRIVPEQADHPILEGISAEPFVSGGSLYRVAPVADSAEVLMLGTVAGHPSEPVAWTYRRSDGGRSFYTSLGAIDDFARPEFQQLLRGAILWTLESDD